MKFKYKSCFLVLALLATTAIARAAAERQSITLQQDEIAEIMSTQETYAYFGPAMCSLVADLPALTKMARASDMDARHLDALCELVSQGYTTAPASLVRAAVEEAAACVAACKAELSVQEVERIADALEQYDHALQSGAADLVIADEEESEAATRGTKKFDNIIVRNRAAIGSLFVGGDETVHHNLTVDNDLLVKGNEIINGTLTIRGATIFTGTSTTISGDLKVLRNIKLPDALPGSAVQGILQLGVDPIYEFNMGASNFFAGDYTSGMPATITTGSHNISIGTRANIGLTTQFQTIAIGTNANATGNAATAIGRNSVASASVAQAFGSSAMATGSSSVSVGISTIASGISSVVMGSNATASGQSSLALGDSTNATGLNSISIGTGTSSATNGIGIGEGVTVLGDNGIALGTSATATGNASSIAIGNGALAYNMRTIALGSGAVATGAESTAIGYISAASGAQAAAIGVNAQALAQSSVALGQNAMVSSGGTNAIAIGLNANLSNLAGANSVAIGNSANATNTGSLAVGDSTNASGVNSIAIGTGTSSSTNGIAIGEAVIVLGDNGIALGTSATATGNTASIAIGLNSSATNISTIAIGNGAQALFPNSIAIGTSVVTTSSGTFIGGIYNALVVGQSVTVKADGQLGTTVSARRFKENFRNLDNHSAQIYKLNPVKFDYKAEHGGARDQFGLIADDVAKYLPEIVVHDKDGEIYSVQYHVLPILLLNEMKHNKEKVDALTARVAQLEATLQKAR